MGSKPTKHEAEQVTELQTLYNSLKKPPVLMILDERLLEEVRNSSAVRKRLSQTLKS